MDAGLPMCLSDNVVLKRDMPKDAKIRISDVEYDRSDYSVSLFEKAMRVKPNLVK